MPDDQRLSAGAILPIGRCRDVEITLVAGDLSTIAVDLAILGIHAHPPSDAEPAVAAEGLNRAMHGAIARLSADGIFGARRGETLFLSSPPAPIAAKGVLLLGLGPAGGSLAAHIRAAIRSAADRAVMLGVSHVAFGPARIETGIKRPNAAAGARALVRGVTEVLGTRPNRLQHWCFVTSPPEAEALATQFRMAFAAVWEQ